MKTLIKNCLFLFSITVVAQEFNGIAYYQTKTKPEMDIDTREFDNAEMKKNLEAHLEKMLNKTYELYFNNDESLYKEQNKLDAPGSNSNRMSMMPGTFDSGTQYKNISEKTYLQDQDLFGKLFLISDSLRPIEWKLENESKLIGQYIVFKASAIIKSNEIHQQPLPRPPLNDTDKNTSTQTELSDEVQITAWYTPQIPISQGPGEYWGLPGFILELHTDKTTILCTKIVLNQKESERIKKPSKGTKVTREEYQKIATEKIKEMQSMGGGQRASFRAGQGG